MRVAVSTSSSSLTSTIVSSKATRSLACGRSQRTLVTACIISAASGACSNGDFFWDLHSMVRGYTSCDFFLLSYPPTDGE